MQIEYRKIGEVIPYENNPRNNESGVEAVAESIKQFGWQQPIVIDKDSVIIAGHTRWEAAQRLGLDEVPVVVADNLTDEQVTAYRLADNKTGELTGWDFLALDEELDKIINIDMADFGFKELTLDENIDDFFVDAEQTEKEVKTITCPHCGEVIEL